MTNRQILKRGALMGAFFFVFYLLLLYNRDGAISFVQVGEGVLAFALFVIFYFLFGKFIRPLIKKDK